MKLLPPLCTDCAEQCLRYIQEYEGKQKDAEIQDSCAKCKDLDKHQNRSTNDYEIRYQPPTEAESEPERHDTLPGTNKSIHTVSRIELNDKTYRTTGDEKIVLPVDCNRNLEFGKAIRQEFLLHEGSIFLNNGSYGAVPMCVHEYKTRSVQLSRERVGGGKTHPSPLGHDSTIHISENVRSNSQDHISVRGNKVVYKYDA